MESGDGGAHSSPISLLMVFAAPSDNGGYEIFCVANAEDCQPTGQQFKGSETKSLSSRGGTCVPAHQQFGGAGREGAEGSIRHPCFKTWPSPSPTACGNQTLLFNKRIRLRRTAGGNPVGQPSPSHESVPKRCCPFCGETVPFRAQNRCENLCLAKRALYTELVKSFLLTQITDSIGWRRVKQP